MQAARFVSWSPLEVGDVVMVRGWHNLPATVTEIETLYKATTGTVEIRHYIDGWLMPLDAIECRLADGKRMPIARERIACEEVRS